MGEVVRHQIQQEAVQQAYIYRYEAFTSNGTNPPSCNNSSGGGGADNLTAASSGGIEASLSMAVGSNSSTRNNNNNTGDAEDRLRNISLILQQQQQKKSDFHHRLFPHGVPILTLCISDISYTIAKPFTRVVDNLYYVQIRIGALVLASDTLTPTSHGLHWDLVNISGILPINDLQTDDMIVEVLDAQPDTPDKAFIGQGRCVIDRLLSSNIGRKLDFAVEIMNKEKGIDGVIHITLEADINEHLSAISSDPRQLNRLEINKKPNLVKKLNMEKLDSLLQNNNENIDDNNHITNTTSGEANETAAPTNATVTSASSAAAAVSKQNDNNEDDVDRADINSVGVNSPGSINNDKLQSLSSLVNDLRGDGVDMVRLLTGDISVEDIQAVGANTTPDITKVLITFFAPCYSSHTCFSCLDNLFVIVVIVHVFV